MSATLMKNWLVAEFGSEVRAMDRVPRVFSSPLPASLRIGSWVFFCTIWSVKPPPWTMKPGITRWKTVLL
ncbi:hypothetical protein D3C75_1076650 [compost metagenome]